MNKNKLAIMFVALFLLISTICAIDLDHMGEEELEAVSDEEIIAQIQNNYKLLENENILDELSLRASEDVSILNENPLVKTKWLSMFAIKDRASGEGIEFEEVIVGEGKTTAKTRGTDSCTFNLKDVFGATITEDGGLVLGGGAKIKSATVIKDENSKLNIEGGTVDLTNCSHQEFDFKNTIIKLKDKEFHSFNDEFSSFKLRNGVIELRGKKIYEKDLETGKKISALDGYMEINSQGDKLLGEDTFYMKYAEENIISFQVEEPLVLLQDKDCLGREDCISAKGNFLEVFTKDNRIVISSSGDESIEDLKVNKILGDGKVIFKDGNDNELHFEKQGLGCKGSFSTLTTNVDFEYAVKAQEFAQTCLEDGKLYSEEGELLGGFYGIKPKNAELLYKRDVISFTEKDNMERRKETITKDDYENKIDVLEGGNLMIRGYSLLDVVSKGRSEFEIPEEIQEMKKRYLEKYTPQEVYFKESFSYGDEFYQLNEDVIISTRKVPEPVPGSGSNLKEAVTDALGLAAMSANCFVSSETEYFIKDSSKSDERGKTYELSEDSYKNYCELSGNAFIKHYKTVDVEEQKLEGEEWYVVKVEVELGEPDTSEE